jgi:hypothetical protein
VGSAFEENSFKNVVSIVDVYVSSALISAIAATETHRAIPDRRYGAIFECAHPLIVPERTLVVMFTLYFSMHSQLLLIAAGGMRCAIHNSNHEIICAQGS